MGLVCFSIFCFSFDVHYQPLLSQKHGFSLFFYFLL